MDNTNTTNRKGIFYTMVFKLEVEAYATNLIFKIEHPEGIHTGIMSVNWSDKDRTQHNNRIESSIYRILCPRAIWDYQVKNIQVKRPEVFNFLSL